MSVLDKGNKPTPFQIEDAKAIKLDQENFRAPSLGQQVLVVVGDGPLRGEIRPATVLEVSKDGRVITARVAADIKNEKGEPVEVVARNAPYVSAERLQLKHRINTWHHVPEAPAPAKEPPKP